MLVLLIAFHLAIYQWSDYYLYESFNDRYKFKDEELEKVEDHISIFISHLTS